MEFRILGPLEVWNEGRRLQIAGDRQRALLAVLLLDAGRVLSNERLITELWGAQRPESGVKALQVGVSQLRRAFVDAGVERSIVVTRAPGYVVEIDADELDLNRFEQLVGRGEELLRTGDAEAAAGSLRDALALWRGEPLQEFASSPFAQAAAVRLEEGRLAAFEKRVDADLALGRHAEIVADLEESVSANPYREQLRAQLMLALYRAGRQSEALEAFRDARRTLVDELGLEPSQRLQDMERDILEHNPALDLRDSAPPVRLRDEASVPAQTSSRSLLVVPHDERHLAALFAVAESLTRRPRREVIAAAVVASDDELDRSLARLEEQQSALQSRGVVVRIAAFTSSEPGADVVRLAAEQDADLLLTDAPPALIAEGLPPGELRTVLDEAQCDIAALVSSGDLDFELRPGREVMVPFGGAEHEWAALEMGGWIASAHGSTMRLLGSSAVPETGRRDASRLLAGVSLIVQKLTGVTARPLLVEPGGQAILDATKDAALLVVGLSEHWSTEGLGQIRRVLAQEAKPPTLLVRRGAREGGLTPPEDLTRYTWSRAEIGS